MGDVVGQRLPVNQSSLGGRSSAIFWYRTERLPERGDLSRRAGPQVPVGPESLIAARRATVPFGVDGGLHEDDAVRLAGGTQVNAGGR